MTTLHLMLCIQSARDSGFSGLASALETMLRETLKQNES